VQQGDRPLWDDDSPVLGTFHHFLVYHYVYDSSLPAHRQFTLQAVYEDENSLFNVQTMQHNNILVTVDETGQVRRAKWFYDERPNGPIQEFRTVPEINLELQGLVTNDLTANVRTRVLYHGSVRALYQLQALQELRQTGNAPLNAFFQAMANSDSDPDASDDGEIVFDD